MNTPYLIPIKGDMPFGGDTTYTHTKYKVYNDGGHYIARTIVQKGKCGVNKKDNTAMDKDFNILYSAFLALELKSNLMFNFIFDKIVELYPYEIDLEEWVLKKIKGKALNLYNKKKRFKLKANLNEWTHFVTFTYDDNKHSAETFRKKLRKCLSNLHTRRGWRYMGVFEKAPETGRLHFHGIFYIPQDEMVGEITEKQDYNIGNGKMQTTYNNNFFEKIFGRNDFKGVNKIELKTGNSLAYLLKYIGKTTERIVYSRGIATEITMFIKDDDIVTYMTDFVSKFILFDDVVDWERDVLRHNLFNFAWSGS